MQETQAPQNNAHKYFWAYVLVSFVIIVVMILYSSFSQERIKLEKEQISEQLTEEKNYSKGIQKTARDISEQNDTLLQENKTLKEENEVLKQEITKLQQENKAYQDNKEVLQKLKEAYVAGDIVTCQQLLEEIKEELISPEDLEQYNIIKGDLT